MIDHNSKQEKYSIFNLAGEFGEANHLRFHYAIKIKIII